MAIKALEQEPTPKDDLGVDCISRADVNQVIEDYMDEQYHVLGDRTRERAFGANAVKARINELQTVALEPKIGHESLTNSEWIDFLSEQFDISRTSAKEMLHTMMSVKKEDNFKKLFNQGKVCLVKDLVKEESEEKINADSN